MGNDEDELAPAETDSNDEIAAGRVALNACKMLLLATEFERVSKSMAELAIMISAPDAVANSAKCETSDVQEAIALIGRDLLQVMERAKSDIDCMLEPMRAAALAAGVRDDRR